MLTYIVKGNTPTSNRKRREKKENKGEKKSLTLKARMKTVKFFKNRIFRQKSLQSLMQEMAKEDKDKK
jgi:hypothetical protein